MRSRNKLGLFLLSLLVFTVPALYLAYLKREGINRRLKMLEAKDITTWQRKLSPELDKTSALIWWNGHLWTVPDARTPVLYQLSPETGEILDRINIRHARNDDWEALSQDERYIYIGNTGDNEKGTKPGGHMILRVKKEDILPAPPSVPADTIGYVLEGSFDDKKNKSNHTNFDCEAFIIFRDSIYLFTKQWLNRKTRIYQLPARPGQYTARLVDSFNIEGLITDACYYPGNNTIALSCYNTDRTTFLTPFVCLLSEFPGSRFFSGKIARRDIGKPFYQVEGITSPNGRDYYLTNEKLDMSLYEIGPHLIRFNAENILR